MDTTNLIGDGSKRYNNSKLSMTYISPTLKWAVLERFSESNNEKLIVVYALHEVAKHSIRSAEKYPDTKVGNVGFPNWAIGQNLRTMLMDSLQRHYLKYLAGEIEDRDSGVNHLVPVLWNLMSIHHQIYYYEYYRQFDDRQWAGFEHNINSVDEDELTIGKIFYYLETANLDDTETRSKILLMIESAWYLCTIRLYSTTNSSLDFEVQNV